MLVFCLRHTNERSAEWSLYNFDMKNSKPYYNLLEIFNVLRDGWHFLQWQFHFRILHKQESMLIFGNFQYVQCDLVTFVQVELDKWHKLPILYDRTTYSPLTCAFTSLELKNGIIISTNIPIFRLSAQLYSVPDAASEDILVP
jgi:hypothetical protein